MPMLPAPGVKEMDNDNGHLSKVFLHASFLP